ncbi:IclR family transcriptional regulator [Aeromicrobium sp.]|uniref:IclR family transcriptional regulator n=1 Tax=Aeromicrobium sp. TaxID=1871063 RepID=UPI003D6BB8C2
MTTSNGTGTQAIDRAMSLVAAVIKADEPLTYPELQDECGLAKSTTSRLLAALERTELLERNGGGGYVAGPLFWLYATRHDPWEELVRIARPTMEQIGDDTRETVNLSVNRGDRVAQVAQVDSSYMLGTKDWTETDVPAHASALGKVLLAYGALEAGDGPFERITPNTIADPGALRRELDAVVRHGWASTVDELEIGLTGVAVPVRGVHGDVIAALGVSGPSPRLEHRIDEVGQKLDERAKQLSGLLRRGTHKRGAA